MRDGHVLNCPYTVADVNRAEEIFGKDLGAIRGRTVRETPKAVRIDTSSVFKHEDKKVILAADLAFIEQIPFLVTISRGLGLMTVQNVESKEHASIMAAVRCNERFVRSRSECVALSTRYLTYYPTSWWFIWCIIVCGRSTNLFPRTGLSQSPKELFTGVKADFKRDFLLQFGSYVQVHEDDSITNTMKPRTTGAMSLGPSGNMQGAYKFLSLDTWKVIVRRSWTELPIPNDVLRLINSKTEDVDVGVDAEDNVGGNAALDLVKEDDHSTATAKQKTKYAAEAVVPHNPEK